MTEKEKMLVGKIYDPTDETILELRIKAHKLSTQYNSLFEDDEKRQTILNELIPEQGENLFLQGPIYFDYGVFTSFGKNCYANFNLTVLDTCPVHIGDNVFFWSQLYNSDTTSSSSLSRKKYQIQRKWNAL